MPSLLNMTLRDLLTALQVEQPPPEPDWVRVKGHLFERGLRDAIGRGQIKAYSPEGFRGLVVHRSDVDAWVRTFHRTRTPKDEPSGIDSIAASIVAKHHREAS